jgi:4-amino-4-deoxy-L-arabinose transferase-like glycosyltransferase
VNPGPLNRVSRNEKLLLCAILAAAFLTRLGVRAAFGERDFWENSYSGYYRLAENVVAGKGLCFDTTCAWWPPLYPLFLALTALGGQHYMLVVIPQALMGGGTAFLAFLMARHLFGAIAGLISCALVAMYPYYVMHDTALQETGMITFVTALAVWLLMRARERNSLAAWSMAGLALGAMALTRASVSPGIALALVWVAAWGAAGNLRARALRVSVVLLALAVAVAPWLIRTYRLTGAAVLSSQTGRALWIGNNAETFSHYPRESIDKSEDEAWSKTLTAADRAELERLPGEIQTSDWFERRGWAFIRANPALTVKRAFLKLRAGFWWRLNPLREPLAQASYAVGYVPVAVLGIAGMFLARSKPETILVALFFAGFACTTVLFWAHTSHRTYLDVYWMVFAAPVLERIGRSCMRISPLGELCAFARDKVN